MNKRIYGLDILKIVSMLLIISLHALSSSKILLGEMNSLLEEEAWLVYSLSFCSVNCYVLISGFFLCESSKCNYKKILKLWGVLVFYSIVLSLFLMIKGVAFSGKDYVYTFFPFLTNRNWFFNIYTLLYLVHPYLNKVIEKTSKREMGILLSIMIFCFSIEQTFLPKQEWTFNVDKGYSIIWFLVLYFSAAYYKKYFYNRKKYNYLCLGIIGVSCMLLPFILKFICNTFVSSVSISEMYSEKWYAYNSLPIYIASIVWLIIFSNLSIENKLGKLVTLLSGLTWGIFVIHTHFKFSQYIWQNWFDTPHILEDNNIIIILISMVLFIFIIFGGVEYVRKKISALIKHK